MSEVCRLPLFPLHGRPRKMPSIKAAFLAAATSVAAYDYSQLAASKDNYGAPVGFCRELT